MMRACVTTWRTNPKRNDLMRIPRKRIQAVWLPLLVLGAGLAVWLVALAQIATINPDGIFYIQQAKAIATGQWHLLEHSLSSVFLYPFLIAFLQYCIHDWILSGQLVSLCFGMGMLLVVYRVLRLFSVPAVSCLTTLLLALTPVFALYSVDVMRDALSWFFSSLSLWLVLLSTRCATSRIKPSALLIASNCAILLAAWSRTKAIVLLPTTCLFFSMRPRSSRIHRACKCLPRAQG